MAYFTLCVIHWIRYAPYFFVHAPLNKWHTYFASSYRVCTSVAYAKMELAKCSDERAEKVRLYELLDVAESSVK